MIYNLWQSIQESVISTVIVLVQSELGVLYLFASVPFRWGARSVSEDGQQLRARRFIIGYVFDT